MAIHSFICNACVYFNPQTDEELNATKCRNCNGKGSEWRPRNEEFYDNNPKKFIEYLMFGSQ